MSNETERHTAMEPISIVQLTISVLGILLGAWNFTRKKDERALLQLLVSITLLNIIITFLLFVLR